MSEWSPREERWFPDLPNHTLLERIDIASSILDEISDGLADTSLPRSCQDDLMESYDATYRDLERLVAEADRRPGLISTIEKGVPVYALTP